MIQRQQRLSHSAVRLYPVLLIAIALIVLAVPSIASATTFSEVALSSRWGPHIYGQQYPPFAPVMVTVADSGGIIKGSAESSVTVGGHYMFFEDDILAMDSNPIELMRGDKVTVTIGTGGSAVVETIEAQLSALFSSTQNKVFVEALPNQAIGVFKIVDASFEFLTQGTTNAEGNLVLNLTISPNELFYIWSADANSNFTSLEVWPAYGMVVLSDDSLWGSGYISDSTATVEVYNGDTMLADADVMMSADGSFFTDDFSPEINIVSGNTIKVSARYETTQFIANLEADMDYVDDTILGKTTPYSFLVARIAPTADPSSSFDETATASSGGAFAINAVMGTGDCIWLASIHPDGNITQMYREFGTSCYSHGNPVVFANKNNQNAGAVSIEELGPRSISSHAGANEITLDIQTAGVTFSGPPQATCDGVGLDGEVAALSPDGRTATWTVSECTTQTTGSIMINDISYDADTSTPDGDVTLEVGGNSGVTVAQVSNAIAVKDLSILATTIDADPAVPDGNNGWYVTAPMITLSTTATATIFYQWDDAEVATYTVPFAATEGESTLTAYAVDIEDDTGTAVSRLFTVDTLAPTTPVLDSVDTITASNVANFAVHGFADLDTTVTVTVSDGITEVTTETPSSGTFSIALDLSSLEDTSAVVFTAVAKDEAGNESNISLAATALKDTTGPQVVGTDPANDETAVTLDETITVTFDENIETGTAFGDISLKAGDAETAASVSVSGDMLSIDPVDDLDDETTYTVTLPSAAVRDTFDNLFESGFGFSFRTSDITAPETSITVESANPPNEEGFYETTVTITLTADEAATIHYKWDGPGETTQTAPSPAKFTAPDGERTLTYYAVDMEGNIEEPAKTLSIKVNALPPVTTIGVAPPNGKGGWYKETAPEVTLTVDETATIHYWWDDGKETTYTVPFIALEGEHTLSAFAIGEKGSVGDTVTADFRVDTKPPSAPVLSDVETVTAINVMSVLVGGLAETDSVVRITASDGVHEVTTSTVSGGTFSATIDLSSLNDTDTVVFTAETEDQAGNTTPGQAVTAAKDATLPILLICVEPPSPDGKNGWYKTIPTITFCIDGPAISFYSWDGSGEITYTLPFEATEGVHTLTAYATDSFGNIGETREATFKVDTIEPAVPVLDDVETITASSVTSIIVNGATDTDTIVHIQATDGSKEVTASVSALDSGYITIIDLSSLADTDTITFTAYAEDKAGNVSDVSLPETALKDATPPVVEGTNPANGATGVDTDTAVISVTLSELIETGTAFGGITLGYDSTTMSVSALIDSDTVNIPLAGPLTYETTYTVTIPAAAVKDGVGNEFEADYNFSFTTKKDIIRPTWSPSSTFIASEIGQTSVKLSWAGASDNVAVTGYRIYSGIGSVHRATVAAVDSTTVTGLNPGTLYTFTIQARDAAGNWSGEPSCGPSVTVTTASSGGGSGGGGGGGISDPAPAAPKSLKVISTQNMVHLGWTANTESDLAGYNIYRKVKDASGSSTRLNSARLTGVEYQDMTAQLGVAYVYYVTAVDNGNNESQKSNEVEAAVTIGPAGSIFFDVRPGDWFVSFVSRLNSLNIIGGYPDKSFRPHQNLTRAEFAKMLCLAMGWELQEPANPSFSDVPKAHWAYKYIETAKARGALGGYPDGSFRPSNSITRAEIAAAIARALNLAAGESDLEDIALHWAKEQINACVQAGIISGYPGNVFRPNANATRAEASKMIAGVLDNK